MLKIISKQVYEVIENEIKQWILILYDISENHYVGIPIRNEGTEDDVYIASLKKYT